MKTIFRIALSVALISPAAATAQVTKFDVAEFL
jgi:hypothetical protein